MKIIIPILLATLTAGVAAELYSPFGKPAFLTSSFGENRGTRYHAGIDYSTNMEEGWVILAPEDGTVEELKTLVYGYGKHYYYKGKSGITYVYAHQSGFNRILDSLIRVQQNATQKNEVKIFPNVKFKKGDTLSFTGSTGIGNPHLHLEMRKGRDVVMSPCHNGTACSDTLEPLILNAFTWNENVEKFTSENALKSGCLAMPRNGGYAAFKIADYSRAPLENPMSISRVSIFEQKKNGKKGTKLFERKYKELKFNEMIEIRERLLWAEEADSAGDYHFVSKKLNNNIVLEVEDFMGHIAKRNLALKENCDEDFKPVFTKFQENFVYSFASRAYLNADCKKYTLKFRNKNSTIANDLCESESLPQPLSGIVKKHKVTEASFIDIYSKTQNKELVKNIYLSALNANELEINDGKTHITQSLTKPVKLQGIDEILAVVKNENDTVPFFEFHPKGLQFKGTWTVCFNSSIASAPLYYLGETTRRWFIFSKQTERNGMRCASMNELRDIGSIVDTTAPTLGTPYSATAPIAGIETPVIRIPVIEKYAGLENGNAINTYAIDNDSAKWIYAEYDSEPQEIVIERSLFKDNIKIDIKDEAGNAASYKIHIKD